MNRDDLRALLAGYIGQILAIRGPGWRDVPADIPLRYDLRFRRNSARRGIKLGGINIACADGKSVVEGTGWRKSDRNYLPYVRLYQIGRALGFSIGHANHPGAHGAGPIAAEEDVVAVRRPAQQLIIGRVLDQADFATPIGSQQEDVPGA